jgi:hypothetical protein
MWSDERAPIYWTMTGPDPAERAPTTAIRFLLHDRQQRRTSGRERAADRATHALRAERSTHAGST